MDIATGQPEDHPAVLPYDPSASPGVAPGTPTVGALVGPTVPGAVFPYADQLAPDEAACHAAMSMGIGAENDRRSHYAGLAGGYAGMGGGGDLMNLPDVPSNSLPPASSTGYIGGDEPTRVIEPGPAAG